MKRVIQYEAANRKEGMTAEEVSAAIADMTGLGLDLSRFYLKAKLTTWSASKVASIEFRELETK